MVDPEEAFNRELGATIKRFRGKAPQASIAEAVGISRTSLVLIEQGKQRVHAYLLVRLASALGTSVDSLLPASTAPRDTTPIPRVDAPQRVRNWVEQIVTSADGSGGGHGKEPT